MARPREFNRGNVVTKPTVDEIEVQRAYYAMTAREYDKMHVSSYDEHGIALAYMISVIEFLAIELILEAGGTER
jgi:hypothetical protein